MRHDRQPDFRGNFQRDVERCDARIAARGAPDPDFDSDDQVAVGVDDTHAVARVEEPQIGAFADHDRRRERENAGMRDVEDRYDAHRRRLDHMAAETVEIAGARAAGVDKRGCAAGPRDRGGVDPERGAAPIDMRMEVDEAGDDQLPGNIDGLGPAGCQIAADRGNLAIGKGDIGELVASVARIDDPAALEDQFRHRSPPSRRPSLHEHMRGEAAKNEPRRRAGHEDTVPPKPPCPPRLRGLFFREEA
jgi:hypothetical protein